MTYSYCFLPQFLWLGFFALFFGVRDYYFVSNLLLSSDGSVPIAMLP